MEIKVGYWTCFDKKSNFSNAPNMKCPIILFLISSGLSKSRQSLTTTTNMIQIPDTDSRTVGNNITKNKK